MAGTEMRLLDIATEIGPTLQQLSGEAEQQRRLPKKAFDILKSAGLHRMLLPKSLGGLEVDPITCARVVEEIARFDSAAGWALQTNSGPFWCARLPDEGAEEVFGSNPDAFIAAAFHPPQQAIEVDGGYRLTGRAPLASTVQDSDWLMLTGMLMEGPAPKMIDGVPVMVAAAFRTDEARVIDTWHTLGMRGTDSNDVVVDNVFVPAARTFPLRPRFTPGKHFHGPLYRFPGIGEVPAIVTPVALAVARAALDEFKELATSKIPFGSMKPLHQRSVVQSTLARAEGLFRAGRALFYQTFNTVWDRTVAGHEITLEEKADLLLAAVQATDHAWHATDLVHRLAGTTGIYTRSRLERLLRDALTLRHHGFVSESKYETVGQVYLGVQPEFPLIAF
jgi:alkylation response protein AidB-like acyl-CoA dehydrogenase